MVIDNPGIREIAFWEVGTGIEASFPEIETLSLECRFTACSHTHEPGCRVLGAVGEGEISMDRLENYRKMKRELEYLSRRRNKSADRVEKERLSTVINGLIYRNTDSFGRSFHRWSTLHPYAVISSGG